MKQLSFLLLFFLSFNLFAQREELLNKIADETCECLEGKDLSSHKDFMAGLCLISKSEPYEAELQRVLGLDFSDTDDYDKMVELTAQVLLVRCPAFANALTETNEEEEALEIEEVEEEEDVRWSDIEAAEGTGQPEYGGPENKAFIVTYVEDTNQSGISKPVISGKVKAINTGLANEVIVKGDDGKMYTLYILSDVVGNDLVSNGAKLVFNYERQSIYHAAKRKKEMLMVVTSVKQ